LSTVEVSCAHCTKVFSRSARTANEAAKKGWLQFCSPTCLAEHRKTGTYKPCMNCGVDVWCQAHRKQGKNSGVFCSKSCAGTYTNKHRPPPTPEHRERTSRTLIERSDSQRVLKAQPSLGKACPVCGTVFRGKYNTCSRSCGHVLQFGNLPLTREEIIQTILGYAEAKGNTPSSKTCSRLSHAASRFFGSWNAAIVAAGLDPNTEWMRRKQIRCSDGHRADSLSERIVDEWLYKQKVSHERHKEYPKGRYTCDFYLPDQNLWVEYFGLIGQHRDYDLSVQKKREIAKKYGLVLVEILPGDLYPLIELERVLQPYLCVSPAS